MMYQTMELQQGISGRRGDLENHSLSENHQNSERKISKFGKVILKFFDRQKPLGDWAFFLFCWLALVTHVNFYQIPEINDHKNCVQIKKVKVIQIIVERSIIDLIYLIYSICELFAHKRDLELSADKNKKATILRPLFLIDLYVILPIPQVLMISNPKISLSTFPFLLVQLVPRIIRMSPRLRLIKTEIISRHLRELIIFTFDRNIGKHLFRILFTCGVFILFVYYYLTAGMVFGSLWYYFAIKKMTACWQNFVNSKEYGSFYCDDPNSGNYAFLDGLCNMKTQNETIYDFGIYGEAFQSGIVVELKNTFNWKRSIYCVRWGIQNLSGFGQGLQPSTHLGENIFVLSITIVGVLLLVFSVGFAPMVVENQFTELAKMATTKRKIRQWLQEPQISGKLSEDLQREIEKYVLHKGVQITKGIDVENLFDYLSPELKKRIKHELCLRLLKKVQQFEKLGADLLKELCYYLKPVSYTTDTHLVRIGDPVYKMIFVLHGELWTYTTNVKGINRPNFLQDGDFCGDELLDWIENGSSSFGLPISNRAIVAHKKVEAFALMAYDLEKCIGHECSVEERSTHPAEPK